VNPFIVIAEGAPAEPREQTGRAATSVTLRRNTRLWAAVRSVANNRQIPFSASG
jgi:hypothetical protein